MHAIHLMQQTQDVHAAVATVRADPLALLALALPPGGAARIEAPAGESTIAICSLLALALAVERLVCLRRSKVIPSGFVESVRAMLADGPERALAYCRASPSPMARIFEAALRRWDRPIEHVEKHVAEAGLRETAILRRHLRGLSVIAAVSPLLGLLGTIVGMIKAFRTVAGSPDALGRTELLAGGIYEAMVTTAAGLIVAIPTLLLYHSLAGRIDRLVLEMDAACLELVERHGEASADRTDSRSTVVRGASARGEQRDAASAEVAGALA
jgi:biopolymer transport protein ExbB